MKTRILSGIMGAILFLFLVIKGGILLTVAVGVLSVLAAVEVGKIFKKTGVDVRFSLVLFFNLALLAGKAFWGQPAASGSSFSSGDWLALVAFTLLFTSFLLLMGKGITQANLISLVSHLFILFYTGFLFVYPLLIRQLTTPYGWQLLLFAFAVIWGTDTGAYFIGSAMGKTPLAPRLSPKKTVEGAVGGLVVGTLTGVILGLFFQLPLFWLVGTGILASFVGQIGDLFASFLKRIAGVKDSGRFLPGHGGVIDRFDSALFSLPVVYYLALFLLR
ncbi:phosphatidate cytidylyltransferase [Hydrogenispora sp. UU3]|uniref:Phosphatidate cytidylyltransferase n=2 Tax=Capillibacterium thermochitinicola TaxID=2699427 RepID=A0A8J6I162_9FIRM|nr:phosphatidate cytidylyltransferase [Capillibacterium thermochitinicola]